MASTYGSLRQRPALRSASARLPAHSARLWAVTPLGQNLLGGCAAKWITDGASWADFPAVCHIGAVEQMFGAVEQVRQAGQKRQRSGDVGEAKNRHTSSTTAE